jgi:hypothetical protein
VIGQPENCENCLDDDGDGKIDRADPDCAQPADGADAGVDAARAKAVDKCAKIVRKAGDKIAALRLKQMGACAKAVADCVQLKAGDDACLGKARTKCGKARGALPGTESKITNAVVKGCGEPAIAATDLGDVRGLGFDGQAEGCGRRAITSLASVADVAECVRRERVCLAERVFGTASPRARELLLLGGFDPATDLACLPDGADGAGSALTADRRKAIRKCDASLQKVAAKLVAGRTKAGQACGAAVFTCFQTKAGDDACTDKASGTCTKALGGLQKLTSGFTTAVAKGCGVPLVLSDLLGADGLGVTALAATCRGAGFPPLATVANVGDCLAQQLACRADQMTESTTPRLRELLTKDGVALP